MGDASPRGQHGKEGADHALQVQVLRRGLLRGGAAVHPGPLPGCVSGDRDTAVLAGLSAQARGVVGEWGADEIDVDLEEEVQEGGGRL